MTARTDLTTPSIILIAGLGLIDGVNILPKYEADPLATDSWVLDRKIENDAYRQSRMKCL